MANEASNPSVLCAGILVADLFVPSLPELPAAGALLATDDFTLEVGGCAANVAVSLAKLGAKSAVSGCVGDDPFGDFILRTLEDRGVDASGVKRSKTIGSSKTVILTVTGEDRRFIHTFGANADYRPEDAPLSSLAPGGVLYFGGYLVMPGVSPESLRNLLKGARERGAKTILDVVVPAGDPGDSMERLLPVLPYADYFLPNEEEARALTGEIEPRRQAERFLDAGCEVAVITRGKDGVFMMSERETLEAPVYPIDFVDGSGSGDAFAAGWILGLLEGWPSSEILRFASAVGASACARLGCTTGVFTRAEAEAFLSEHPLEIKIENRH